MTNPKCRFDQEKTSSAKILVLTRHKTQCRCAYRKLYVGCSGYLVIVLGIGYLCTAKINCLNTKDCIGLECSN